MMQVSKDADAAGPIYKHGQNNMMPNWHDRQQVGQAVMLSERRPERIAQSP